jgi:hypothetical protein
MRMTDSQTSTRRRRLIPAMAALAGVLMVPACTKVQTANTASSYLIMDSLQGAPGAEPNQLGDVLASDVVTLVGGTPTVFGDVGVVTLRLAMVDPGSPQSPSQPTSTNFITVTRYHVKFTRTDGHNIQGVDVPFEFDGAATGTVRDTPIALGLTLVRSQAKFEAPLTDLVGGGGPGFITTVAEVTLFGTDQAGRAVSVTGYITVNFADWADPA